MTYYILCILLFLEAFLAYFHKPQMPGLSDISGLQKYLRKSYFHKPCLKTAIFDIDWKLWGQWHWFSIESCFISSDSPCLTLRTHCFSAIQHSCQWTFAIVASYKDEFLLGITRHSHRFEPPFLCCSTAPEAEYNWPQRQNALSSRGSSLPVKFTALSL